MYRLRYWKPTADATSIIIISILNTNPRDSMVRGVGQKRGDGNFERLLTLLVASATNSLSTDNL